MNAFNDELIVCLTCTLMGMVIKKKEEVKNQTGEQITNIIFGYLVENKRKYMRWETKKKKKRPRRWWRKTETEIHWHLFFFFFFFFQNSYCLFWLFDREKDSWCSLDCLIGWIVALPMSLVASHMQLCTHMEHN